MVYRRKSRLEYGIGMMDSLFNKEGKMQFKKLCHKISGALWGWDMLLLDQLAEHRVKDWDLVLMCLKRGASPQPGDGVKSVLIAALVGEREDLLDRILAYPQKWSYRWCYSFWGGCYTALETAIVYGSDAAVRKLMAAGASADTISVDTIHDWARNGRNRSLKRAIQAGVSLEGRDKQGRTVLITAAQAKSEDALSLLLAAGANVYARDSEGHSALYYAVRKYNNAAVVQALVDKGGRIRKSEWKSIVNEPIHAANYTPLVAAGDVPDNVMALPEMRKAFRDVVAQGKVADVATWVAHGADVNEKNDAGQTVLMSAVREGHTAVFDLLVKNGADLSVADRDGNTVLAHAALTGRMLFVKKIVGLNASLMFRENKAGYTPQELALNHAHLAEAQFLEQKAMPVSERASVRVAVKRYYPSVRGIRRIRE